MKLRMSPSLLTHAWHLKLTALGLALLLWAAVRSEEPARFTMNDVPVQLRLTEEGWVRGGEPDPATVAVEFVGPVRDLVRLAFAEATLVIPVEDIEDTLEAYRPRAEWLEYDARFDDLRVDRITPAAVQVPFQPIVRRLVPVAVRLDSPLKPSTRLVGPPRAEPARVMVEGPRNRILALDSLIVRIADVESALGAGSVRLMIDTTGLGMNVDPREVVVRVRALPRDSVALGPATGAARP